MLGYVLGVPVEEAVSFVDADWQGVWRPSSLGMRHAAPAWSTRSEGYLTSIHN